MHHFNPVSFARLLQAICELNRLDHLQVINTGRTASDEMAGAAATGLHGLCPEISRLTALTDLELDCHICLTELPQELFTLTR